MRGWLVVAVLAVLAGRIAYMVVPLASPITPFGLERCVNVRGALGAEDFAVDPDSGVLIVASAARKLSRRFDSGYAPDFADVGVYAYHFDVSVFLVVINSSLILIFLCLQTKRLDKFSIVNYPHKVLKPHGVSLYYDAASGTKRLFLVNHLHNNLNSFVLSPLLRFRLTAHASSEPHVEGVSIFDVDVAGRTLTHLQTVVDPLMRTPNDVVAVGPDRSP